MATPPGAARPRPPSVVTRKANIRLQTDREGRTEVRERKTCVSNGVRPGSVGRVAWGWVKARCLLSRDTNTNMRIQGGRATLVSSFVTTFVKWGSDTAAPQVDNRNFQL